MSELVQSGSQYTDEQRRHVIADYAIIGIASRVAERHSMPERTVNAWVNSEWGVTMLAEIREQNEDLFQARFTEIIDKGTQHAIDNIDQLSPKDAVVAAAVSYDKLRLSQNKPTRLTGNVDQSLEQLSKKFKEMAKVYHQEQASIVSHQDGNGNELNEDE